MSSLAHPAPEPARRAILRGRRRDRRRVVAPAIAEEAGVDAPAAPAVPAKGAILVTGANSGVGLSAAKQLAAKARPSSSRAAPRPRARTRARGRPRESPGRVPRRPQGRRAAR